MENIVMYKRLLGCGLIALLMSFYHVSYAQPENASDSTSKAAEKIVKPNKNSAQTNEAKTADANKTSNPIVVLETSNGIVELELFADKAPISVKNFLQYVDDKFYDGTIFHRVIGNFMVQGGGILPDGSRKKTRQAIKNEANNGLNNEIGTIAMARTARPDTATSQFFINVASNTFLNHQVRDYGYAVFGRVTKGLDVVKSIETVETDSGDRPLEDVILIKASRK